MLAMPWAKTGREKLSVMGISRLDGSCGNITIGADITLIEANKGVQAYNHIGKSAAGSTCGTVTMAAGLNDSGEGGSQRNTYP